MFLKSQPKVNTVLQELIWFYEPSCEPAARNASWQNAHPAREQPGRWTLSCTPRAPLCLGGYFWVLRLCWHSEMLKETPVPQCHLPSTQGFPQSTQWGWRNIMPLPFLGVGWQHLSQDLGKASSAGSALSISAHPFLFNKHFWVVLSSSSPYRAPISMPLKDGCGSPCLPKLSHLGFPSPERTAC